MAKGALNLLREMERKYVRAIEQMSGASLVVQPRERVRRELEENLEAVRQKIRALETDGKKSRQRNKRVSG